MKFYDYVESRFLTSQIGLNKKQSAAAHAENQAIRGWMWLGLKMGTAFHLITLPFHFLGTRIWLFTTPKTATQIALDHAANMKKDKEAADKLAEEGKKIADQALASVTNIQAATGPHAGA